MLYSRGCGEFMIRLKSLSKSSAVVDIVLNIWQRVPAPVIHNLQKAQTIKLLFWHCAVDQLTGNYLEFGVAHGHSMKSAVLAERFSFSKAIGVKKINRNLIGFDTFEKFISTSDLDAHETWVGDLFNLPLEKIQKRFRRYENVSFIKCDASSLSSSPTEFVSQASLGINGYSMIILFDMDLYAPTLSALRWAKQTMQQGTFLMFDEFFSFAGDFDRGESLALKEFLDENPSIRVRDVMSYGSGGKVFVVATI
jgi:O-methyltransferase